MSLIKFIMCCFDKINLGTKRDEFSKNNFMGLQLFSSTMFGFRDVDRPFRRRSNTSLPSPTVLELVVSPVLGSVAQTRGDKEHVAVADERGERTPEISVWHDLCTAFTSLHRFLVKATCHK
jgi:hypothetical protein